MMDKNRARLIQAMNALLGIKTDNPDMAANVIDVIEQIDCMIHDCANGARSVREWMNNG